MSSEERATESEVFQTPSSVPAFTEDGSGVEYSDESDLDDPNTWIVFAPAVSEDVPKASKGGKLVVTRISVADFQGIPKHNMLHKAPSPLCALWNNQELVGRTKKKHATVSPTWDVAFAVDVSPANLLTLQIIDHHNFHKDKILCCAEIVADDLEAGENVLTKEARGAGEKFCRVLLTYVWEPTS